MDQLDDIFDGRVLAMGSDQWGLRGRHWAARSPDLTPPDFALWPIAKKKAFTPMPTSLQDLKNRIKAAFREIEDEPGLIDRLLFTMFFVHTGQDRQCFSKQLSHLIQKVIKFICITF